VIAGYDDGSGTTSTHSYSVWGASNGDEFCCTIDDTLTDHITSLVVIGTAGNTNALPPHSDTLAFSYARDNDGVLENNLTAAKVWGMTAYMYGGNGDDLMYGSDSTDSDYVEELFGQAGDDFIDGEAGKDYLDDDTVQGGKGADVVVGGYGSDVRHGNLGADTTGPSCTGALTSLSCGEGSGDPSDFFGNTDYGWSYLSWECEVPTNQAPDCTFP
jgi:Ca2+-binding RTX toxin-like protein